MSDVKVAVTFRRTQATNALQHYAEGKIHRNGKYFSRRVEAYVVLSVDTHGNMIHGKEESDDLHSAIDLAIDKIQCQVQKQKEKTSSMVEGRKIENYRLSN